ncbi:hypothetical protein [Pseudomonas sp. UBA2684]|uniref:hypothetical protein n=1 Tax=Pseudomonas sp. UBA2684 TaxID=1947311 RepID=UPI0025E12791|nr:hypothetical protein [Pseudomonas sp. UBA2684]|tara:strand:+ start:4425 stop:4760 length:336 start_codon:yes stop_codon:yes gene_type:complete
MSKVDFDAPFQRTATSIISYFVATPLVVVNGLPTARLIRPFSTREEADRAAALLNERYPNDTCISGSWELDPAELDSPDWPVDERLAFRQREARGDLAALLAGIPLGRVKS